MVLKMKRRLIMKKRFLRCVAISVLTFFLSVGSVFAAENMGFYVGIFGGYVIPQKVAISDPDDGYDYFDMTLNNGSRSAARFGNARLGQP
jgi:hypothetical protein